MLLCFRYESSLCWCSPCPTTGGRRTLWSGSPAVWMILALMRMTLWRRLSRVRTFLTTATMKVGTQFQFWGFSFVEYSGSLSCLYSLFFFLQTATWDSLSAKTERRPSAGHSSLTGTLFYNRYTSLLELFTSLVSLIKMIVSFCVFPEERLVFLSRWS